MLSRTVIAACCILASSCIPAVLAFESADSSETLERELQATLGSIAGTVQEDTSFNGNGNRPLVNVTMSLFDDTGATAAPDTVTDADGTYVFTGLPAGNYTVQAPSEIRAVGNQGVISIGGSLPLTSTGNDFVWLISEFWQRGTSIKGSVMADTDGDGTGDTPLSGEIIRASYLSFNVETRTRSDGSYSLRGLRPGRWRITWGDNTISRSIRVCYQCASTGNNFVDSIELGSISGTVQEDTSFDGNGNRPLVNVTMSLFDDTGATAAPDTVTDADGTYVFTGLPAGSYTVQAPTEIRAVGNQGVISIGGSLPLTSTGNNFIWLISEFWESGTSIEGSVMADTDGDGIGDTPLSGELILVTSESFLPSAFTRETRTTSDGSYSFSGLRPSTWSISWGANTITRTIDVCYQCDSTGNNFIDYTPTPSPTGTPAPTTGSPLSVECAQIDTSCSYNIVVRHSELGLGVQAESDNEGASIVQVVRAARSAWRLESVGSDGFYHVIDDGSGFALNVEGASTLRGSDLIQWPIEQGADNDDWCFEDVGDGYYRILSKHSGYAIDIESASVEVGANALLWTPNPGFNQQFRLTCAKEQVCEYLPASFPCFNIVAKHSGMAISVDNDMTTSGVRNVVQKMVNTYSTTDCWYFQPTGTGFYHVISQDSGEALNVDGASSDNGRNIIQYPRSSPIDSTNDNWCFELAPDGSSYTIVAEHSGKAIDVPGASMDEGTPLIQWSINGYDNQLFQLVNPDGSIWMPNTGVQQEINHNTI